MKKYAIIILFLSLSSLVLHSQIVYVDCNSGNDKNTGTEESPVFSVLKAMELVRNKSNGLHIIRINPGIYVLDKPVVVATDKDPAEQRIVIEANVLPGDTAWTPEKMPVIISTSKKGETPYGDIVLVGFRVEESHVTIKGLKFYGFSYPNSYYFPVLRYNKKKTDLLVEQCMFVGDYQASHIQVAVIAHGNETRVDHCIFYNVKNAAVFFQTAEDTIKTGNGITNSIIYGANHAIWTSWPDKDFIFENNIVSDCNYFWIKNYYNKTVYPVTNCIITGNKNYQGVWHEGGIVPEEFEFKETGVIKDGEINLRLIENIDNPVPLDYLHVINNSQAERIGAGLFIRGK